MRFNDYEKKKDIYLRPDNSDWNIDMILHGYVSTLLILKFGYNKFDSYLGHYHFVKDLFDLHKKFVNKANSEI